MTFSQPWNNRPGDVSANPPPEPSAPTEIPPLRTKLWVALNFHDLPLFAANHRDRQPLSEPDSAGTDEEPVAVYHMTGRVERIVTVSRPALTAGIHVMMKPGEARATCPALHLLPRNPRREQELLSHLAEILGEFSSEISIYDELTLIMEVGRSLRLFGGIEPLIQRLEQRLCDAPGYHYAMAPSPAAAALCARGRPSVRIDEPHRLRSVLGDIPVTLFETDEKNLRLLQALGVDIMRDLFRLPRQGLTRRFGAAFTRRLEELLGTKPDLAPPHAFRTAFSASLHLDTENADLFSIMPAARRLLDDLEQQLLKKDSAVQYLSWTIDTGLPHDRLVVPMQFAIPVWRADALSGFLRLRLEAATLCAPARTLTLETGDFVARSPRCQQGIPGLASAAGFDHEFLDRLHARLGHDSVRGLRTLPEYRPEYSWSTCEPGKSSGVFAAGAMRPLWLLETPQRLVVRNRRPCLDGPLRLRRGEERLRGGWWDGRTMARDYRQALTPRGRRLWVFKDLTAGTWHLHGLY